MLMRIGVSLLFLFLIAACCNTKNVSEKFNTQHPTYKEIAKSKYENYKVKFNTDSTYAVVYSFSKKVTNQLNPALRFFIYNNKDEKVIFEDNLTNGNVEWINNHQLKVTTEPEIISGIDEKNKEMFGYIYDTTTKRKLSKLDINK